MALPPITFSFYSVLEDAFMREQIHKFVAQEKRIVEHSKNATAILFQKTED
jgi:hypothetical protein